MKITFSIIFIFFVSIYFSGCKQDDDINPNYDQHIKVGALIPLSGTGASPGKAGFEGIQLAIADINQQLERTNPGWQFEVIAEDTETDTVVALAKYNKLKAAGIKVIIGPYSSAVLKSLKPHADADKILLVSPASVAKSLAQPNDQVFRLLPNIISQSEAVSALMVSDAIEVIIPIYRSDIWGIELLETTVLKFEQAGFSATEAIGYDPAEQNFEVAFDQLQQQLELTLQNYPPEKIGIYLVSYDEGINILERASTQVLFEGVRWYGNSAFAENQAILNQESIASFAELNQLLCPSYGLDPDAESIWKPLSVRLEQNLNRKPEIFAFTSYDATWLTLKTYIESTPYPDADLIRENFVQQSRQYFGATGWTNLNEAGDRDAAAYDFWGISTANTEIKWEIKARYNRYNNLTGELIRID